LYGRKTSSLMKELDNANANRLAIKYRNSTSLSFAITADGQDPTGKSAIFYSTTLSYSSISTTTIGKNFFTTRKRVSTLVPMLQYSLSAAPPRLPAQPKALTFLGR